MGEKTEDPTPQKLREARKKGQVAKSQDFSGSFMLLIGSLIVLKTADGMGERLSAFVRSAFEWATRDELRPATFYGMLVEAIEVTLAVALPVLGAVLVIGVFLTYMQVGSLFVVEPLKPDVKKLNPIAGFKNMFKMDKFLKLGLDFVKLVGALAISYHVLSGALHDLMMTELTDLHNGVIIGKNALIDIVVQAGAFYIFMGVVDLGIQRWQHKKSLRMSKDDVKQEYKSSEGDPEIKGKRKQIAMETVMGGGAQAAAKADAVVTNPTHLATAIQYDRENWAAPRMTAKGRNVQAERIKAIAREHGVPIVQNVPLAQALFELEVDEEIPEDLYEAVAEVLSFVYRLAREEGRL